MKIDQLFLNLKRVVHRQTHTTTHTKTRFRSHKLIFLPLGRKIRLKRSLCIRKCLAEPGAISDKYVLRMYESSNERTDTRQIKRTCHVGLIRRSSFYVYVSRRPINLTLNPPRLSVTTLISSSFD